MLTLLLAMTLSAQRWSDVPDPGISESLARERAATIRNLHYELALVVYRPTGNKLCKAA